MEFVQLSQFRDVDQPRIGDLGVAGIDTQVELGDLAESGE